MKKQIYTKHPFLTLFIVNAVFLLIVFAIFEAGLRMFAPDWLTYRMQYLNPESQVGNVGNFGTDSDFKIIKKDNNFYSFEPDSSFQITHYEYNNHVIIDSLGGRANGNTVSRIVDRIIPFIGDSFIFGVGVNNNEHPAALLESSVKANIINLGVPGTTLPQQKDVLRNRLAEFNHPEKVIWGFFLGNDFEDLIRYYEKKEHQLKDEKNESFFYSINSFVFHNPILKQIFSIQFFRQILLNFMNKNGEESRGNPIFKLMYSQNQEYRQRLETLIEKEIKDIDEFSKKQNIELLFVLIPDSNQINIDIRKKMSELYGLPFNHLDPSIPNRMISTALTKQGIRFLDPTQCLLNNEKKHDIYYKQDNHFTAYGQSNFVACIQNDVELFLSHPARNVSP